MNRKELLEQGLRQGIPLWRIEDALDWQENTVSARQSALLPKARRPTARSRALWQPLSFFFGWFFNQVMHKD